jgi:hypothetical protein
VPDYARWLARVCFRVDEVGSGSTTAEMGCLPHVRYSSGSDRIADIAERQFRANRRHQSGVNAGLWEPHLLQHPGCAHRSSDQSRTHFEDHVERRLGRAAEALEACFSRDLTQSAFTRLGTEPQANFLRE